MKSKMYFIIFLIIIWFALPHIVIAQPICLGTCDTLMSESEYNDL